MYFASSLGFKQNIYLKLYAVEPICKMKVDDWVFGLTRINANVGFWRQGAIDLLVGSVG